MSSNERRQDIVSVAGSVAESVEESECEVFVDCGASPELRRSTRTSSRKRSSTGGQPAFKPKKKMSVRTPNGTEEAAAAAATGHPPSGLAQPQAAGDPILASMQAMLSGMEGRLNVATANLQASVTVKIDGAMAAIGDLRSKVNKQEERIDGILDEVSTMVGSRIEKELRRKENDGCRPYLDDEFPSLTNSLDPPRRYSSSYATALASVPDKTIVDVSPPVMCKKEFDYWTARKSLRVRPILPGDDMEGTLNFFRDSLKLDSEVIESLGRLKLERIPYGPKSKQKNEILVRFHTVEARDIVRGSASNLAGQGPDVGIRLELPNHLKTNMKALQQISYEIKTKHPTSRRNVLYDDDVMDLALDFSLGDGQPWRRITPSQAKDKMKEKKMSGTSRGAVGGEELDRILDGGRDPAGSEEPGRK